MASRYQRLSPSVVKRELDRLPIGPPYPYSQVERKGTGNAHSTNFRHHSDTTGNAIRCHTGQARERDRPKNAGIATFCKPPQRVIDHP